MQKQASCLQWLCTSTWSDISTTIMDLLAQHTHNPSIAGHLDTVKWVVCYLKGTKTLGICLPLLNFWLTLKGPCPSQTPRSRGIKVKSKEWPSTWTMQKPLFIRFHHSGMLDQQSTPPWMHHHCHSSPDKAEIYTMDKRIKYIIYFHQFYSKR